VSAALAARLTVLRNNYVIQLDASIREVTGDPAALRKLKDRLVPEAEHARTTGGDAGNHAGAAQSGWQGGAYTAMRARVQGVVDEFTDAGNVISRAAASFDRAATALETAAGDLGQVKQKFTEKADSLIEQAQQVQPPQEAAAGAALTKNMEASGKVALRERDKKLQRFDQEMEDVDHGIGPAKTATVGKNGKQGYVIYPNGEVRVGGDRAWRNNNPGNLVYGDRAKRFGAIGTDGFGRKDPFAVFPDQSSGDAAMRDVLREKYGDMTFAEALPKYAPPFENNVQQYLDSVARQSGLDVTTRTISSYSQEEFDRLVAAMRTHERSRPGTVYTRDTAPSWLLPLLGP
jgi:hypothetical protein